MAWKTYEDLDVFCKSYQLAIEIHKLSSSFPTEELYSMTSQIRKSSKSVCSNIAEGHGKSGNSLKEFIRFLNIAVGSAEETKLWLSFCKDLNFVSEKQSNILSTQYVEVIKMLHGLIKSLQK